MKNLFLNFHKQSGQTLIETLAAIFILTMGITSAVGLAIYALNSTSSSTKQIIAAGLAREGVEAVKNMRDSNWLQQTPTSDPMSTNCYNFASSTALNANCYHDWLGKNGAGSFYCLDPSNGASCNGNLVTNTYILGFDASQPTSYWVLNAENSKYGLNFNQAPGNYGFFNPGNNNNGVTCATATSDYCRKITITKITTAGSVYDPASSGNAASPGPLVQVQSQVWWVDKKCPRSADWPGPGKCSVEMDTYLTNWKDN